MLNRATVQILRRVLVFVKVHVVCVYQLIMKNYQKQIIGPQKIETSMYNSYIPAQNVMLKDHFFCEFH